ncbi:eukaryotic translation initiation factor eIF2A-domain-containing protein [Filobasidium floriforme]|uniref:eukaryotic translation initiation factor eIF2A-domain-containing protein n=1 Tax=Filobasidium floriforme TaxID=5210 RepID=UPI001E8CDFB5|nr:eukaryotic translation initiation factor eIF2A-domain-containing protein [Filobasidium floriforme]KAH8084085.1 eukaryotic translation initiation factor eIF2A-domain-containing protein [Filobasidium floriforme]
MSAIESQYAFRAQKTIGLVNGDPSYAPSEDLPSEAVSAKTFKYSPTGRQFAYVHGSTINVIALSSTSSSTSSASLKRSFEVPNVIDLAFSPLGSYLFTWERMIKVDDGQAGHKNLKVWFLGKENRMGVEGGGLSVEEVREVAGFGQKSYDQWQPMVTDDESHLIRLSGPSEISIFSLTPPTSLNPLPPKSESDPSSDLRATSEALGLYTPVSKVRSESTIRGLFLGPSKRFGTGAADVDPLAGGLGVWVGEYKGQPASVNLYTLRSLRDVGNGALPVTQARKSFFKGDKVVLKWNKVGSMGLFLTTSDVDNSGKSYYGETNLYLVGLNGQFECKVALDKEGPIHDYAWNPNSREFSVCYGYMPARTVLFDLKANPIHSFEPKPRNFIAYQPQGRLFLNAGFGNLTGTIDVWDLKSRKKVSEFQAPNSTTCEWSPDGRYILTGTLSPRLRVDNGVKVWWCTGKLLHVQMVEELYQTSWRPGSVDSFPAFPLEMPAAPAPHTSVAQFTPANKTTDESSKPVGAYRPPGARGTATPSIYKREDEGGAAVMPSANGSGAIYVPGTRTPRSRNIPGAPPGAAKPNGNEGKGKKNKKNGAATGGNATPAASAPSTPAVEVPPPIADGDADATQKKIRNLNKKLKAIVDLKERKAKGEVLEATQLKKIEGETAILQELKTLESSLKK